MTGYNLPPGVNVSDIPGNRPEDDRRSSQATGGDRPENLLEAACVQLCACGHQKGASSLGRVEPDGVALWGFITLPLPNLGWSGY